MLGPISEDFHTSAPFMVYYTETRFFAGLCALFKIIIFAYFIISSIDFTIYIFISKYNDSSTSDAE